MMYTNKPPTPLPTLAEPRRSNWRQGTIFGSGLALGLVAAAAWVLFEPDQTAASAPKTQATVRAPQAAPAGARTAAAPAPAPKAVAVTGAHQRTSCPAQAATPVAEGKDGQFLLQADVSGKTAADVPGFILAGKEAAAAGRTRDAEVAFLMACRVADKLEPDSAGSADARYQLGRHYASLANAGGSNIALRRPELLQRAELLYSDSLQSYRARYGEGHEKSRFAAEGLASVRQTMAQSNVRPVAPAPQKPVQTAAVTPPPEPVAKAVEPPKPAVLPKAVEAVKPNPPPAVRPVETARAPLPAPVPLPEPKVAEAPKPAPKVAEVPKPPPRVAEVARPVPRPQPQARPPEPEVVVVAPVRQAQGSASGLVVAPSFDCNKARSYAERTICADPELARLDRDLGRLHARAKSAAPDSAAFRRRNEQEWRRRESTCRDRECLLRWYGNRRDQLVEELEESRERPEPTASR